MKFLSLFLCAVLGAACQAETVPSTEATIVVFRHGEKPKAGLGMLSCQGLNRALALPAKLFAMFGPPQVALVPNPSMRKKDSGVEYGYNRPLLTMGPSAIAAGIPIVGSLAWNDHQGLAKALLAPDLAARSSASLGSTTSPDKPWPICSKKQEAQRRVCRPHGLMAITTRSTS